MKKTLVANFKIMHRIFLTHFILTTAVAWQVFGSMRVFADFIAFPDILDILVRSYERENTIVNITNTLYTNYHF